MSILYSFRNLIGLCVLSKTPEQWHVIYVAIDMRSLFSESVGQSLCLSVCLLLCVPLSVRLCLCVCLGKLTPSRRMAGRPSGWLQLQVYVEEKVLGHHEELTGVAHILRDSVAREIQTFTGLSLDRLLKAPCSEYVCEECSQSLFHIG